MKREYTMSDKRFKEIQVEIRAHLVDKFCALLDEKIGEEKRKGGKGTARAIRVLQSVKEKAETWLSPFPPPESAEIVRAADEERRRIRGIIGNQ